MAVFTSDEIHRVVVEEGHLYERYYLHFLPRRLDFALSECPSLFSFFTNRPPEVGNVVQLSPDRQHKLIGLLESIKGAQTKVGATRDLSAKIRLLETLLFLREDYKNPLDFGMQVSHRRDADTRLIMQCMKEKYAEPLRLDEICEIFYISKSTLIRLFRDNLGMTPMEYLNKVRVMESRGLLQAGKPVQEVAQLVGYKNSITFIRNFKRIQGISPKQYALEIIRSEQAVNSGPDLD